MPVNNATNMVKCWVAIDHKRGDSLFLASGLVVCKIPLLARRTRPKGQARRATIGYLVYNDMSRDVT